MVTTTSTTNSQFGATAQAAADKVSAQAPTDANKDMFTKLLVAQIQNQDPLSPQDPTQYVNQLSQLSQTEALQNLSATTTASATVLQSLQTLAMGGQVGSDVTVATSTLKIDGSKVNGTVQLDGLSAGTNLILHPRDRTAVRINPGAAARAKVDQMRKDGTLPAGSEEIIVKRVQGIDDAERQRIQRDVRIQVSRALAENGTAQRNAQMQVAPLMNGAFADVKWSTKATTKDLGTRDFGGIKAEGKLRSYEIPAGAIGNRNAIVVSDETWTAPDLQVTVYTKHSDPRSGDVVFRLENIKREEPAAALFAVPADYTVREAGARWRDKAGRADK